MKIESGKLDRQLQLLAETVTKDALGQVIKSFANAGLAYGQRLELRTQDAARAGGRDTFKQARYLIRWRANITTAMRVREGDTLFDIVAIDEPDRRATLILTLEEVVR